MITFPPKTKQILLLKGKRLAMQYREFGKTGYKISALGFGAMRLPEKEINGKKVFDHEESIRVIRRGIDLGINYIDSAYGYCNYESETIVGKALKDGYRKKVKISTKFPTWSAKRPEDFEKCLDEQLKKLDTDKIDFYHFHSLNEKNWNEIAMKFNLINRAFKAKEEGKIDHLSFSFHDNPDVLKTIIDSGFFESMLVQYNILDRSNEEMIAYAALKGLGVAIMGTIGGGRLGENSEAIMKMAPDFVRSTPELALRFVLSNPNVHCALSGMNAIKMVDENVATASSDRTLTIDELETINHISKIYKEKSDLNCTYCKYCMPCPNGVNIPLNFRFYNYYRIYELKNFAREQYLLIGKLPWYEGKCASECIECGECEPKCPQKIPIIKQLKETHKILK